MRISIKAHLDYSFPEPADVLLQIEAAAMADQRIEAESLTIYSDHPIRAVAGESGIGQRCWAHADRRLVADYEAIVAIDRPAVDLAVLPATAPRDIPSDVVRYLLPSRYCESDRFEHFVRRTFDGLTGGALAVAMADWVHGSLEYAAGVRSGAGAMDTFVERRGVCRDFAHLLVALARAGDIPARCAAAYAPGVDPPDFHAVAELWLDGRWHLIDPTRMADSASIARVAVGLDATEIAFMTIFGRADLQAQWVSVAALDPRPRTQDEEHRAAIRR